VPSTLNGWVSLNKLLRCLRITTDELFPDAIVVHVAASTDGFFRR
jgi:hypothetical protein